jgi:hypothetical protein
MPHKIVFMGCLMFLIGLLFYLNYDWTVVLMVAGILIFLKGLYIKLKMKMCK